MAVDVLIGQAYFLRFDRTLWDAQRPYAPLGALYAAAHAREGGHRVALFDAMLADSTSDWSAALHRHRPAVAVIYEDSFNYLSKMCLLRMREAAMEMIAAARAHGIPVVVAGSDATDHPATYLDGGATAVITGEGEITLVEVLDALRSGNPSLTRIAGLVVRENGALVRTSPRAGLRDLDTVPRPAWDLVDVERYRAIWMARHGHFSMNIATTRGCPYHCNWCAKPIYGQRYTARSAEDVAGEVAWLKRSYHPDHLWITDDIFGLKPGWIDAFARAVRARDAVVPFKCLMRADGITAPVASALRSAGCRTVWIGAESGSQRILDAMEKGTRVEEIECAVRLLRAVGVEVCFFLQFGYPGETLADIALTLEMVRRCQPDDIGISVSYPLPGTPFHDRVRAQLGDKQNWIDSGDLAMMYRATFPPEFYRALHTLVHARFRAQRGWSAAQSLLGRGPAPSGSRRLATVLAGSSSLVELPLLSWRVRRLARRASSQPTPAIVPILTRQAAALPSEQGH
ncbi:MAG TPA: radical SAM protein [Vicinamibacterales bacterium]|nr:radical SAM protein [Vicinamibacterales bacterium]